MSERYSVPNCDAADLNPGDLIAWEGRALRVVNIYPVEPVDWRDDEKPGQFQMLGYAVPDEYPPCRIHLDDGSPKGLHLRVGFRPRCTRNVERLKAHHPVCSDCGYLWPCPDERIDRVVAAEARELERACNHCGKTGGGMQMFGGEHLDVPGQMGAWFHTRTQRRAKCADAADAYLRRRAVQRQVLKAAEQALGGDSA